MKRITKNILQIATGLALAGGGLYIFFGAGDGAEAIFQALVRDIANTSAAAVAACAGLTILATVLRAVRWHIMLPPAGESGHKRGLFAIMAVSQMVNNILPARLGELARVILLWKRNKYPIAISIGSLLLERAFDSLAYLLFLFVPVFLVPQIAANLHAIHPIAMAVIWVAVAAFAVTVVMFLLYVIKPHWFKSMALRFIAILPQKINASARKAGAEIRSSLDWIFSWRKTACVAALSLAIAMCYSSMIWVLAPHAVGFLGSLFAQAFAACGSAIPLAPGYVGTLHAVLLQGLDIVGMDIGKGRALAVLYHALGYIPQTALGLIFFATMHVKLKEITEKKDIAEKMGD
jgi:uncharacterized protein (TIRG00374 family)